MMETITIAVPPETSAVASVRGSVVVTGAGGFVGRRLLQALASTPAQPIAVSRRPVHFPATRVLAGPLDASRIAEEIEDAELVVHLAGALRPVGSSYWDANVETAAAVARALRRGAARRVVFLSYVGASLTTGNEYLRAKAEAERILAAAGPELVVFRATHIIGPPEAPGPMAEGLQAGPKGTVLVPGDGTQLVAPVFLDDVVAAIMAALAGGPAGHFDLSGPDVMALNDLVALLNPGPVRLRHVPERLARLAALFIPSLPAAAVNVMLRPSLGEASRAMEAFGIAPRSLRALWS